MTTQYIPKILDVLIWPNEGLETKCQDVTEFDEELKNFATDMFATMSSRGGVGLAAPQVGRNINMFVLRIEDNNPLILINPEITPLSNEMYEWEEGCLSVPGYFAKRKRPERIAVLFKDLAGTEHAVQFGSLYAFAIQHEYDHLTGKCFVDNLPFWRKTAVKKKIKKELPRVVQQVELMKQELQQGTIDTTISNEDLS